MLTQLLLLFKVALVVDRICISNSKQKSKGVMMCEIGNRKDSLTRKSSPPTGSFGLSAFESSSNNNCKWTLKTLVKYGFIEEIEEDDGKTVTFQSTTQAI